MAKSLQTNLSAFWQLDNVGWTDEIANAALTPANAPTLANGIVNSAVRFASAATQKLTIADAPNFDLGAGKFSLQTWVKLANGTGLGDNDCILSKNDGGFGQREYAIGTTFTGSNVWSWTIWGGGTSANTCNSSVSIDSNWHHLVCTWDPPIMRIYVDTVETRFTSTGGAGINSTSALALGFGGSSGLYASASQNVFLDQVGLWKGRILDAADVQQLYNEGNGLSFAQMGLPAGIQGTALWSIPAEGEMPALQPSAAAAAGGAFSVIQDSAQGSVEMIGY